MNAFQSHPNIFHTDKSSPIFGTPRVELLWGSRFVLNFFNQLEEKYPFADNLKTTTRALLLGIKSGWVGADTAADLLRFFGGTGIPWKDLPESRRKHEGLGHSTSRLIPPRTGRSSSVSLILRKARGTSFLRTSGPFQHNCHRRERPAEGYIRKEPSTPAIRSVMPTKRSRARSLRGH